MFQITRRALMCSAAAAAAAGKSHSAPAIRDPHLLNAALPRGQAEMRSRMAPIPREEFEARQDKARALMASARLDAVLLMGGSSLAYFTGVAWGRSERIFAAVLPRRGALAYVCPAFERRRAEEQIRLRQETPAGVSPNNDLRTWEEHQSPYRLLAQVLRDRGARRLGMEETLPYFVAAGLSHEAPAIEQAPADAVTAGCRMIKSPREVALMEAAAEATRQAIAAAFRQLREGMVPRQLAEAVAAEHAQQGVRHGFALVAFGAASAFPHGSTSPQKLREGDVVLIDAGCTAEGYQSDVTRTTVFGRPSDKFERIAGIVKKAQSAALAAARPGASAESVDAAARRLIEQAGFGPGYKFFTHRLGHGIGLDGHEWPYLVAGNKLKLASGMTFSDEPGIYIPGEFGVRFEDVMVIAETEARLLA